MHKIFRNISLVGIFVIILSGCATPHVVKSVQTTDTLLNCNQIENEMADADRFRNEADKEKGVTGTNVAAVLFFWPAMIGTYSNANEAMAAAETRKAHLMGIYMQKKCGSPEQSSPPIVSASKGSDQKLRELKDLFDKGLITSDEYSAKHTKIVADM